MTTIYKQGTVGALLHAYQQVITALQETITGVSNDELVTVADIKTTDENCSSIQTILTHVVSAGYRHTNYIRQIAGGTNYKADVICLTADDYSKELDNVFSFIAETFINIEDNQLEELDNNKKLITNWHQVYDIEQMAEHAMVHFIKHKRQIENFKLFLRAENKN